MAVGSKHGRWTSAVLCLTFLALATLPPPVALATAPANDDFAAAQSVAIGDRVTGSIADATAEVGEPATSSEVIANTVWYRLTTAATEAVRIDTCARNAYSEVAVFRGTVVDSLVEVTHSQYECSGGGRVYFTATAGTTYHVRVAGYDSGGAIALTVARPQAPANDDFANAQAVAPPATVTGSTVDATLEPEEPETSPYGSGHSVWYRWTAGTTHPVRFSTCDDFASNTVISIYTGTSVGALTSVGSSTDICGLRSIVTLHPVAGVTYFVSIRGNGHTADAFTMEVSVLSPPPLPELPPPPKPTCPFQLAAPGSVTYRGTHSAGGEVCITLRPDFGGVAWFHLVDPPPDLCGIPLAVERLDPAAAIEDRAFALNTSSARVKGTFPYGRGAHGTFQAARGTCLSRVLTWSAVTTADPPWLTDTMPPRLTLSGSRVQRPLRTRRVVVHAGCPREKCAATATTTVAGIALKAARTPVAKGARRTLRLALSARARRSIRSALRARRSIAARIVVTARDAAGNRRRATRSITLRR